MNFATFWDIAPHAACWVLVALIFDAGGGGGNTFQRNVGSHTDYSDISQNMATLSIMLDFSFD
jgi:hypothetical protein